MSELDDLIRDLRAGAATWFNPDLHRKLERLIEIAKARETLKPKEVSVESQFPWLTQGADRGVRE